MLSTNINKTLIQIHKAYCKLEHFLNATLNCSSLPSSVLCIKYVHKNKIVSRRCLQNQFTPLVKM